MLNPLSKSLSFSVVALVCGLMSACGENENDSMNSESVAAEKSVSALKPKLNDTGITWGGNYPADINTDCSAKILPEKLVGEDVLVGDILPAQDCSHGIDAHAKNDSDGVAGFSYQKISEAGDALPADAAQWQCVTDTVSGLMWEVKKPADKVYGNAGLHDADDLYMWYYGDVTANGGAVGNWNSEYNQCAGYTAGQPATYCNISEFVSRVNEAGLCGSSDWRVPTRAELESLVYYGTTRPAVDVNYFPSTVNDYYWSISPTAAGKDTAWAISFQFGFSAPLRRDNPRAVRLVRGAN